MPKQRITLTRTETIVVEIDYKIDPHTRANTEFWANQGWCGSSPIGKVGGPTPITQTVTDWRVTSSTPPLSPCAADIAPKAKPRRRT